MLLGRDIRFSSGRMICGQGETHTSFQQYKFVSLYDLYFSTGRQLLVLAFIKSLYSQMYAQF